MNVLIPDFTPLHIDFLNPFCAVMAELKNEAEKMLGFLPNNFSKLWHIASCKNVSRAFSPLCLKDFINFASKLRFLFMFNNKVVRNDDISVLPVFSTIFKFIKGWVFQCKLMVFI
ncbi:hypothetical protein EDEG_01671 [Edhazardia aedis USNM 41457]|uniref:Uncharacterized protein n=1 Tax=Edhazardia aedis (strain USNM 41457) TaxID=1003232 RepID=J9DRU4_EDHAE|nr:hypothetical protein EDEG_01671 [Edhazardia aedis USNM 41457]|eukprot:EJW04037.1 hypothetical protein EDEG_01671 [Edhazardia aedis USNM 41457]